MKRNLVYLAAILICAGLFALFVFGAAHQTDSQPPEITFPAEIPELSALEPRDAFLQGVTAHDDVDGDVTESLVVASVRLLDQEGTVQVHYAAFDAAGNVAQATRQGVYTDYENPRFSLSTSLTFADNSNFDVFDVVRAADMLDGDISHRIRICSVDDAPISGIGVHEVELKTSNSLGGTASLVVPVEVYAAGTYDAALTLKDYLVYLPADESLDAESYLKSYSRAGTERSLENGMPRGYTLEMKNNVQTGVPGVYTVEYRVSETVGAGDGARVYTGYAKLIVVVEG